MRTLPDFRRNLDFAERVAFSKPVFYPFGGTSLYG